MARFFTCDRCDNDQVESLKELHGMRFFVCEQKSTDQPIPAVRDPEDKRPIDLCLQCVKEITAFARTPIVRGTAK